MIKFLLTVFVKVVLQINQILLIDLLFLVGTSEKYGTSLEGIDRTIRLLLIDPQNVKKLIMVHIEKSSIQSILKMARQKYRKKYNYITIPSGDIITIEKELIRYLSSKTEPSLFLTNENTIKL